MTKKKRFFQILIDYLIRFIKQKVLGRTSILLSSNTTRNAQKKRLSECFYCCLCIRCCGKVFTKPLPSNEKRIHIQTHTLMGGIYEARHSDGFKCMIYISNLIETGSGIQNSIGGIHRHSDVQIALMSIILQHCVQTPTNFRSFKGL
jgi:hypothetical protein